MQSVCDSILFAIRENCRNIGPRGKFSGYYFGGNGYDGPEIGATAEHFIYSTPWVEENKNKIRTSVYANSILTDTDRQWVIDTINRELRKMGFDSRSYARSENCKTSVQVGYTAVLAREKYRDLDAFKIYINVEW